MTNAPDISLAISLFSEILTIDQLVRNRISKALPKGMELSHFTLLNHLVHIGDERTPAQLAKTFHLTRGALSNTLSRMERQGYVHVRPDWDDARRKLVAISPAGRVARDQAVSAIIPLVQEALADMGADKMRVAVPILRDLRIRLADD
ncbi:MarR family winged helix-turn-helix transcriptional regulator [Aestuariibius sp. 2305UL40-4]|uniref:MarR family winged helix-turn-helix transcriptional regulator n=1 Tax=Aestuariibius violaceus TaxID=3234132 RepID=UPI00345EB9E2